MVTQEVRQQERIVNAAIADVLRRRFNLNAQAELLVGRRQPDILIVRDNGPLIFETEIEPAPSVDDDALSKLGLMFHGRKTDVTFAVTIPGRLRRVHQSEMPQALYASEFTWRAWYSTSESDQLQSGGIGDLVEDAIAAKPRTDDLAIAVDCLDAGAKEAGSLLYTSPGSLQAVANVFERDPSDEVANMAALMCINAMVFHDRLRQHMTNIVTPPHFITNIVNSIM